MTIINSLGKTDFNAEKLINEINEIKKIKVMDWEKPLFSQEEVDSLLNGITYDSHIDKNENKIRIFETGATRDTDIEKLDFEGFLSPIVLERYAEYMNKHRKQPDGNIIESDNWQKGIPVEQYMKSLWRHFFTVWKGHRQKKISQDDLCAVIFNSMGMLHEILREEFINEKNGK